MANINMLFRWQSTFGRLLLVSDESTAILLAPGEHEIRAGIEGQADDFHGGFGLHGRLTVARNAQPVDDLLRAAIAILIQKVPSRDRVRLVREIPKLVSDPEFVADLRHLRSASKLVNALHRKAGITWKPTPSYKPRV
jgi:hypothetical protein